MPAPPLDSKDACPIYSFNIPPPRVTHGPLTVLRAARGGGEFEPCLCGMGDFLRNCPSLSREIQVFQRLLWKCLKLISPLSQADGSEEKVFKKVTVAELAG